MSDEPAKIILGDTAISAFEGTPGRRRFGRGKDTGPLLTHCENCGAELQGHWCAQCGQPAIEYRRSFRYVVADLLNEFLNWDSKFFTTIALLILKPWRLTNEFLAGKRVRYVNPLRLYLLASILFFFAVNFGAKGINFDASETGPKGPCGPRKRELKKEDLPPAAREKLEALLRDSSPSPTPRLRRTHLRLHPLPRPHRMWRLNLPRAQIEQKKKYGKIGERPFVVFDDAKSTTPFERWIEARAKEKMGEHGTKMGLFISTLFSNLPYMMLCCIPLFALCFESSLYPAPYLLYRPSDLCVAYPHLLLRRRHADCAGDDWAQSFRAGCSCRMADRALMDRVCDANFLVNPLRLPPGLVLQYF